MALPGSSPLATSVTATMKLSIWSAICTPKSSGSCLALCSVASDIEQSSPFEGTAQRDLVGVLQVSPDREPAGQSRDLQTHRLDHAREVGGRGLPLEVGVGGQDQLRDGAVGEPGQQ